jgi:hypothetical protein
VNLPATNVPRVTRSKAKTLGLQHLQPSDVGAGSGPPCGPRIIHHGADELFVKQDFVPDGKITSVQEMTQHAHSLSSFLSDLIDVRQPGKSYI